MIGAISQPATMAIIDRLLGNIRDNVTTRGERPCAMTVKDFDGLVGAVKAEIMLEGKNAIVTSLQGDVIGTLGWNRSDLIGADILETLKIKREVFESAFKQLSQNGWALKHNEFKGMNGGVYKTTSVILWREVGKSVVEFIFRG